MQHKRFFGIVSGIAAALAAPAASAHSAADGGGAFFDGIVHQLSGIDHILAMLAVGMWAVQQGASFRVTLPFVFFCSLLLGAGVGLLGLELPAVDAGVATSVLVLGLFVALAARLSLEASLPLVIVFAVSHGNVHGLELAPMSSLPLAYAIGFLLAAASLQLAGIGLGTRLASAGSAVLRVSGLFIACGGLVLWA